MAQETLIILWITTHDRFTFNIDWTYSLYRSWGTLIINHIKAALVSSVFLMGPEGSSYIYILIIALWVSHQCSSNIQRLFICALRILESTRPSARQIYWKKKGWILLGEPYNSVPMDRQVSRMSTPHDLPRMWALKYSTKAHNDEPAAVTRASYIEVLIMVVKLCSHPHVPPGFPFPS